MTQLVDCHSHTAFSGHGSGTIAQAVARAQELGLATYAQTEHLTLPAWLDPKNEDSMDVSTKTLYKEQLVAQRTRLEAEGSSLELLVGIEADWLEGRSEELCASCQEFEYVLGSVHFIDGLPIDNSDNLVLWNEYGVDEVWRRYFDAWLAMACSDVPFDCFAHPDLPKVFGWLPSFDMRGYFDAMAQAAANRNVLVEVNTAGLRKQAGEAYPSLELLSFFRRHGVECTVGCDAHRPADIGADGNYAYELMRRAGYDYVAAPTANRSRRYFSLEE